MKSPSCFILSIFLFSTTGFALFPYKEICSSSCGQIQNIQPPFRLKGNPHYCGDTNYELTCEGNHTFLNLLSGKYYVTNLSFSPDELQIVSVDLARGECHLPLGSISPRAIKKNKQYELISTSWASFVNCTGIIRDGAYRLIPCLSRNNMFVYVVSAYKVKELKPSCSFLSMVPTIHFVNESLSVDAFQLLQKGFTLTWISIPRTFGYCFTALLRAAEYAMVDSGGYYQTLPYTVLLEIGFLECVSERKDAMSLPIAIAIVMLLNLILLVLLGRLIIAPLVIYAFLGYTYRKMLVPIDVIEKFLRNQRPLTPTRYSYSDIATLTNHFKEKLGQGGFGSVFKGKLPGGQLVAVKILGNSTHDGEDFINEVATIGRIHHKNVVQLLGFCSEGSKRALVYEYMPNGSLDKYIFSSSDASNGRPLSWDKLQEIALGVARGIDYLHRGCDMRILHFDIKPHNILLDEGFNPKVSDFGLARLYPKDHSLVSVSAARGTIGYIAPELISRNFGITSHKSDVYSYGMLLLKITGGRRNVHQQADNSSQIYYPSWIYERLAQSEKITFDDITDIVDDERELPIEIGDVERKLCKVGLWCIQIQPPNRPSMRKVIEMLEADIDTLPMPPKPFYSSPELTPAQPYLDTSVSESSIILEHE